MAPQDGLENRRSGNVTVGSNPTLSANFCGKTGESEPAHSAPFPPRSTSPDGANPGTLESSPRSDSALQGWQPIETAPKDGTPIDLWVESDDPERPARRWPDMHWSDDHACNVGFDWTPHRQRTGIPLGGLLHRHVATHWQPLPEPPLPHTPPGVSA